MRCYSVDGKGLNGLIMTERAEPERPGRGEALVSVKSVALNYRDLMVMDGRYGGEQNPPILAASDMCGVVEEVGEGVESIQPGVRVVNAPFRCWPDGRMRPEWIRTFVGGNGVDGVLAERIVYPADALVKAPEHMSNDEASTLTIAGLTAWAAVVTHGRVQAGEWILLHGTGGVSIFGLQLARLHGARTIISTSSKAKAAAIQERFGVDAVIDYRDAQWPEAVREITGGAGADLIVEVAGGASLGRSINACNYAGRVCVIGVLDGKLSEVNVRDLLSHQVNVRGIFMESTAELRKFVRACAANRLKPCIDRVFPFEQAREAYEHLQSQQHIGKVVIQVAQ
ncbi:NAD(P)-dependent alcohol dehydrogenase [Candidatus Sumerlaeota bacterium]|nr:NAD(P)-dependent alcohol dehydrogenase [Candidatus Sumerlaeota bacterium]